MDKADLIAGIEAHARTDGPWVYDIPLPHGVWTGGNRGEAHTRLKRLVQIVADHMVKPLSDCRILDLGSLEVQFSVEFALQGAEVVGIDVREANVRRSEFVRNALNLQNLRFVVGDAREISTDAYGHFDAIVCSGLLYHLTSADAVDLVQRMHDMSTRCVVIDTHISLSPFERATAGGHTYAGHSFTEHNDGASRAEKTSNRLASADNDTSFWFSRPSLVNVMQDAGFSSVYECLSPAHLNFGNEGLEHADRITFLGLKSEKAALHTSPRANQIAERWPENTLAYSNRPRTKLQRLGAKVLGLSK